MMATIDDLVYWIHEREEVRRKKEKGLAPPWSRDPVFQTTYFTNVRREHDKVTKWIRQHWPHDNVGLVTLARMFNLPEHLACLNDPRLTWDSMKARSKKIRADGNRVFNGAYIITTCGAKMDKIDYVYDVAIDVAEQYDGSTWDTLAEAHADLMNIHGMGSFLSAQVVADLKNTKGHRLESAVDWWNWCAPGPGSLRGIRAIDGYQGTSEGNFLHAATGLYKAMGANVPVICMQDFQNCLCEFSKYVRVKVGGRSKRKYHGS